MNTTHKLTAFWDNQANIYDARAKIYEENYLKAIEKAKKHLSPNDIVLDYACGTGIITTVIAQNVAQVTAIDISSKMIEEAKQKAGKQNIRNISFIQTHLFDKTLTPQSFDVILAYNILHFIKDTKKTLQRFYELLKPGGIIITGTPCTLEELTLSGILIFLKVKLGLLPYMHYFKGSRLEKIFTASDFQIIEKEMMHHTPSNYFIAAKKII